MIEIILLLLVLCLQAADLYLHLAGTQEKPRREVAHFDLAATDLKREEKGGKMTKRNPPPVPETPEGGSSSTSTL